MNKVIKKIVFTCFLVVSIFFSVTGVKANNISRIDMDIYIDANGNATVTEVWKAYLNSGTQGYKKYSELGNSSISNFTVSDDSGKKYESLSSWNVNADFNSKAYKSGINKTTDGVELYWGISNYGNRQYTLKYSISNFVKQYTDTQGIYTNFLDLDLSVSKVTITIRSDIKFSLENSRIWAFGNSGTINFVDGKIVLDSGGSLSKKQYMVGLVRFNSNIFNTTNKVNKSFDEDYNSAMKGANKGNYVPENSINSINMDVYIDANGNAIVTEKLRVSLYQGTEICQKFDETKDITISDFTVSDSKNKLYESLPVWDKYTSFFTKSEKSGINKSSDGVELCWGISNYDNDLYTLRYTINNLVTQYIDTQGINFKIIDLEYQVKSVQVTVHSDTAFSLNNSRATVQGVKGIVKFEDDKIMLMSDQYLNKDKSLSILIKFKGNLFNTSNKSKKIFNHIPFIGEDLIQYGILLLECLVSLFILYVILAIPFLLCKKIVNKFKYYIHKPLYNFEKKLEKLDFGDYEEILRNNDKINYWRDVPCNKDLHRAYLLAYNCNILSINNLKKGIVGAILLKWIKEGRITVSKTKKSTFNTKDNDYAINFNNMLNADNKIDNDLLKILKSAAGYNGILEKREFNKWCKKNHVKMQRWFNNLYSTELNKLKNQGLIYTKAKQIDGLFGFKRTIFVQQISPKLGEEALQLKGLRKFLLDFSTMPQREYFEVHIWQEYLIFAQLLGIADKVAEQFSKLYPNFAEQPELDFKFINTLVTTTVDLGYTGYESGHTSEVNEAFNNWSSSYGSSTSSYNDYSGSDRDSGGGGSSYDGGGTTAGGSSGGGFN